MLYNGVMMIFDNGVKMRSIEECWKDYLRKIIGQKPIRKDDAEIYENIGNYYRISDPLGLGVRAKYKMYTPDQLLEDTRNGVYDIDEYPIKGEALYDYLASVKDPHDMHFVYTYPNRLIVHFGRNQLNTIVERLVNNIGSNRAVAVTLDPVVDAEEDDIPCLQFIQCLVRDNELRLQCLFRSNDVYGAFPSNMLFLTYIGMLIVEEVNKRVINNDIIFGGLDYYCSSGHIYNTDMRAAKKVLKMESNNGSLFRHLL